MTTLPGGLHLDGDDSGLLSASPTAPIQRLARHFSIYAIGAGLSLVCSLALLPVYAIGFSASEFGLLATTQVVALAVLTVTRFGVGIGMFRYLAVHVADGDQQSADRTIVTCLIATCVLALIVTFAGYISVELVASSTSTSLGIIALLIASNLSVSAPREIAEFALRAQQRAAAFVVLSSSFLVLSTILTAVLVLAAHTGVPGVFAATLAANFLTGVAAVHVLRSHLKLRLVSSAVFWRAIRFGAPSVPALLADWVTQYSDRFFLAKFAGLGQVGVYSMAYRIGLIEQQVLGVTAQSAWDPFVLGNYRRSDGRQLMGRAATYIAAIGVALVVLIATAAPGMLHVMHARQEYFTGVNLVFLIALANLFGVMQYLFLAPTSIRLRPEIGLAIRVGAAALNIALNFWLISAFGIVGAAWATLLTFTAAAIVTEGICRRLWRIDFQYRKLVFIVLGGVLIQVVILTGQSAWMRLPLLLQPLIAVAAYGLWLTATGVVTRDAIDGGLKQVRRLFRTRESVS